VGKSKMKVLSTIAGYLRLWQDAARWRAGARHPSSAANAPAASAASPQDAL
jgi:hypothetical protein